MINLIIGVWEYNNSDDVFLLLLFMLYVYMFYGKINELEFKNNFYFYWKEIRYCEINMYFCGFCINIIMK